MSAPTLAYVAFVLVVLALVGSAVVTAVHEALAIGGAL